MNYILLIYQAVIEIVISDMLFFTTKYFKYQAKSQTKFDKRTPSKIETVQSSSRWSIFGI